MPHYFVGVNEIKCVVCEYFNVPAIEMVSERRSRYAARPRQIAMALAYELTPLSTTSVGRLFGDRDHTTVMHACDVVWSLASQTTPDATRMRAGKGKRPVDFNPVFAADVAAIRHRLVDRRVPQKPQRLCGR